MPTWMNRFTRSGDRLFAPEDGGGAPAAAAPPAATPPAGAAGNPPAAAPAGGQAGAPADGGQPAPAAPYRPDGLPDTMFGADDRATMDNMAKALKGYRERDATRQVGENPDAYMALDVKTVPETVRPFMQDLTKDPVWSVTAAKAHELGLPVQASQSLLVTAFEAAHKAGLLDDGVDAVAERQKLLPPEAANLPADRQAAAIDARLQANEDWVKLQIQNGGLGEAAGEHALLMLMDRADGNAFIEWVKGKVGGGPAQPQFGANGKGGDTAESLRAELDKPEMQAAHPKFDRAKWDALQARYKAVYGE